ncbi:hypothetical protein [Steroidobacter sp.]|uniref:hypothetical protein n=1 Tax=Steroidobacter sp. TaxID=1978227 RepID=UPI001A63F4B1|nr:hypothetical protein [Steroidobacter sp.]MBL8266571.1 hypothetical protein [Steroidobacter sp.]
MNTFVAGLVGALAMLLSVQVSATSLRPAVAEEPIEAVVAALSDHQIIAVGEVHQLEAHGRFWLRLIREPRVIDLVNDVVVEAGSSTHQATMDRFVAGEPVPYEQLRRVWEDANPVGVFDVPMYEELFWAVRARNLTFPTKRPLRVILAGPGIDWSKVKSRADFEVQVRQSIQPEAREDYWVARRIAEEVVRKGRKALVLQGQMHAFKTQPSAGPVGQSWEMSILRTQYGAKVFSLVPVSTTVLSRIDARANSWPTPFLIHLAGTAFGSVPLSSLLSTGASDASAMERFNVGLRAPAETQLDAIVVLESASEMTFAQPTHALCMDKRYIDRRLQRLRSTDGSSKSADAWLAGFTARCDRTLVCHALYELPELSGAARIDGRCGR